MSFKNNKTCGKKNLKQLMNEEHQGFVITLEVMATLVMLTIFICFTLYMVRVMNVQRYMNTVLTSTASEAARWGGANSKAYTANVSSTPLGTIAQQQLNYVAQGYNPHISISPAYIQNPGDKITATISYNLPPVFQSMNRMNGNQIGGATGHFNMTVQVSSIMDPGKLLQ